MTKFSGKKNHEFPKIRQDETDDKDILKPREIKLRMKNLFSEISGSSCLHDNVTQDTEIASLSSKKGRGEKTQPI